MENKDKIHDPLFAELFRIALPLLMGYQSDLGHDTLRLAKAVPGERYLWGVRAHGTELHLLDKDPSARSAAISQTLRRYENHHWYILEIVSLRPDGYCCAGTITSLGDPMHHEPPAPVPEPARPTYAGDDEAVFMQDNELFKEPL